MIRLNKIASLLKGYDTVIDFACDHAHVLKIALDKGYIKKGIAIDNKKGPLDNAKKNLCGYNVDFILTDSFSNLDIEFDACVISGVGFNTIKYILNNAPKNKIFILSSHSDVNLLRKYLAKNNYKIVSECLVYEDSIYYQIIVIKNGNMILNDKELEIGLYLEKDDLFLNYSIYKINKLNMIKKQIKNNDKDKIEEIDKKISFYTIK